MTKTIEKCIQKWSLDKFWCLILIQNSLISMNINTENWIDEHSMHYDLFPEMNYNLLFYIYTYECFVYKLEHLLNFLIECICFTWNHNSITPPYNVKSFRKVIYRVKILIYTQITGTLFYCIHGQYSIYRSANIFNIKNSKNCDQSKNMLNQRAI